LEVGVVLQGGGALGAYECGAARTLLEFMECEKKTLRPVALVAVSGVSIGAVNAACMVGANDWEDARRRLAALWGDLTLEMPEAWSSARWDLSRFGGPNINVPRDLSFLGLPGFYSPRADLMNARHWTSFYDTSPLIKTLKHHVLFGKLNESATRFAVSAVNVKSGMLVRFCNYLPEKQKDDPNEQRKRVPIEPHHVLASASLPPQFPWTKIEDKGTYGYYWDGGIVDNTPLGEVMDAFSPGDDVDRVLVVMNLYPLAGRLPRNLAEVEDRKHELTFGNRLRQDGDAADRINRLLQLIKELQSLAQQPLDEKLQNRIDRAGKIVTVIQIDLQQAEDDADGLRDFSRATVASRQKHGRKQALEKLSPVFSVTLPLEERIPA
jgi:predicted acylesterase/phospholipase RssA